jgi:hypothetical protein
VSEKKPGREWVKEAQKLLLSLRDISSVDITLSDDATEVAEINILAEGHRPPKQIVRDVRSALRAEYQVEVDYRKISVAQRQEMERARAGEETEAGTTVLALPAADVEEEPPAVRLRFEGVTLSIHQNRCRVRVELSLGDREAVGDASGNSARSQVPPLVAMATLEAAGRFLDSGYSFVLSDVKVLGMGDEDVVVVAVKFFSDRSEKTLTGSCVTSHDLQQSVVYATLAALNRILGRLRYREPVEYELRPTSVT